MDNYIKALYLLYLGEFDLGRLLNMTWEYNLTDEQYQDVINRYGIKYLNQKETLELMKSLQHSYGKSRKIRDNRNNIIAIK